MKTDWRTYPPDPRYEVSISGEVRRIGRVNARRQFVDEVGYCKLTFSVAPGKWQARHVHRMVMETFVGPCPVGKEVSHLNGNANDNRLANLIYESRKENHARKRQHGTDSSGTRNACAKLTDEDVRAIRNSEETETVLAARHGVARSRIGSIRRREGWTHLT